MLKLIPQVKDIYIDNSKFMRVNHIALAKNLLSNNAVKDFLDFCRLPAGETNIFFEEESRFDEEEYSIFISDRITVKSSSVLGQIHALQTLKQVIFQCKGRIPFLQIHDKPKYKIRGFMLDAGRYFYSVSDVKKIIRRMALHKLNFFHFHLTEDQGWRVETEKYPLLTEKGSKRSRTNFDHKPHSGYYSKNDIKEIVRYAHDFGIKVMPEFDIPGHSRAAIACYKELSCFERDLPVADHWGVKHDVLCVGKDSTFEFVYNVIDELCEMFPDEYIHIGGDEVAKHRWNLCPHCIAKRKELGIEDSDGLQFWFMNRVKEYCAAKGKKVFMWSWELENDNSIDADLGFTKCGEMNTGDRPFIDTSTDAYYIDLPYGKVSLKNTADHKPLSGNCLGVEATLWTEYVPDLKKGDRMSFPRVGAMSETGWSGSCSYADFEKKLHFYYSYLDENNIGYSDIGTANPNALKGALEVLWFERRQLAWEGLHNIFDDKKIEKLAKNINR